MNDLRILRKVKKNFEYRAYVEAFYPVKYASNGELRICCPWCQENKYKLYINDDSKFFHCFRCGVTNGNKDVFDFIATTEGLNRGQAILRTIREYADLAPDWETLIETAKNSPVYVEEDYPNPFRIQKLAGIPGDLLESSAGDQGPFWEYLTQRGLSPKEIRALKVRYVADEKYGFYDDQGRYRGDLGRRFLIPVYGGDNELVSWVARTIEPGVEPKYFNAPDSDAAKTFWPIAKPNSKSAVVVEGIFDALAVRRLGLNAYASLGKNLSREQIELLKKWDVEEVVLFWDKKDALKDMMKAVNRLRMHFSSIKVPDFTSWPAEKDAGDALRDPDLLVTMQEMLTKGISAEVDTWEFTQWKLFS